MNSSSAATVGRVVAAAVAAMVLLVAGSFLVRVASPDENASALIAPSSVTPSSLTIEAPGELSAGDSAQVTVLAPVADRSVVSLGVFGALESTLLQATASNGTARFELEPSLLDHAGRVTLVAEIGSARATHELVVRSGPPVEPVVPLVGPRTIVADGEDATMIVVSPVDEFGNPMPNRTQVTTQVVRPGGQTELLTPLVDGGVAASIVTASTTAGRVSVTASVDGRSGPANVVEQVAGQPAEFTLRTVGTNDGAEQLFADGFSLFEVSTSELRDSFGNVLPDGVVATFFAESSTGMTFAEAVVQGGYATATLQAPTAPGEVTIQARSSGRDSAALALIFKPAIASISATSEVAVDGSATVIVGPVTTIRGGYPADDTLVTVRDSNEQVLTTGALYQGFVALGLGGAAPETISVEILGERISVAMLEGT